MISSRPRSICFGCAIQPAFALALLLAVVTAAPPAHTQTITGDAGWRDVNLGEYRQHLEDLDGVTAACQQQRASKVQVSPNPKSPYADVCDLKRVGPDDRVHGAVPGETAPRQVRYDWLRSLLARASRWGNATQPKVALKIQPGETPPPTVDALLNEARQRLQADEKQAGAPVGPTPNYAGERQTLNSILSERAYKGVSEMSTRERFFEWLFNELNKILASLMRFGSRSPWIGWTLRILLLLCIGVGLVWALLRIERRARIKLIPDVATTSGAPSAREWQQWLKDAQAMAAKGQWREAIHFLYWASIARLESRRLWPADRTRTPREYLGLLPGADPRKPSLTALTRSFERTWYGGRAAASADFNAALEQAAELGVRSE